jgi:periplasmic divalent cation tolerance protein
VTQPAVRVALVSCPVASAEALARALVEAEVAACVNVLPAITSIYRWQGEVSRDEEALLLIKTTQRQFESLRREVLARHPYELPEVIALEVTDGHGPYLEWVAGSVGSKERDT